MLRLLLFSIEVKAVEVQKSEWFCRGNKNARNTKYVQEN